MKERGILMSGAMVRAVLDDRKTKTRRVIKPQPKNRVDGLLGLWRWARTREKDVFLDVPIANIRVDDAEAIARHCPYGQPGDRLWVRETFVITSNYHADCRDQQPPFSDGRPVRRTEDPDYPYWRQCYYAATEGCPELIDPSDDRTKQRWSPSIHMPRWASRLTLEITEVRVERIREISDEDIRAEGFPDWQGSNVDESPYASLWDSLNAKRGYGWDANPWVWVISFTRLRSDSCNAASEASQ